MKLQPHNYYFARRDVVIGPKRYFPKGSEVYFLGEDKETKELCFLRPHHGTAEIRVPWVSEEDYKSVFVLLGGEEYEIEK